MYDENTQSALSCQAAGLVWNWWNRAEGLEFVNVFPVAGWLAALQGGMSST